MSNLPDEVKGVIFWAREVAAEKPEPHALDRLADALRAHDAKFRTCGAPSNKDCRLPPCEKAAGHDGPHGAVGYEWGEHPTLGMLNSVPAGWGTAWPNPAAPRPKYDPDALERLLDALVAYLYFPTSIASDDEWIAYGDKHYAAVEGALRDLGRIP